MLTPPILYLAQSCYIQINTDMWYLFDIASCWPRFCQHLLLSRCVHASRNRTSHEEANVGLYCYVSELPCNHQVPPLTPGTNQKMSLALVASFKLFEKEQQRLRIPRGEYFLHFPRGPFRLVRLGSMLPTAIRFF